MKMKSYPSFDAYFADQPAANQAIIKKLRAFVKRAAPALTEAVKYGNGCWLQDGMPICYVYAAPDHTQFGFLAGAGLEDPARLLNGAGKWVRHIRLEKASDLKVPAFTVLLDQAIALGHPARRKAPRKAAPKKIKK